MSSIAFNMPGCQGEALGVLYREFYPRVLGLCRYLLGSPDEAEDASSEVFLRLPKALRAYDRALPFARWLSTVTGRHCLDRLRRRSWEQRRFIFPNAELPALAATDRSALDELLWQEQREAVRAALARLPERYFAPLVLRYYHELSYGEISAELGLLPGTVKTRIFRAKKELHTILVREQARGKGVRVSGAKKAPCGRGAL